MNKDQGHFPEQEEIVDMLMHSFDSYVGIWLAEDDPRDAIQWAKMGYDEAQDFLMDEFERIPAGLVEMAISKIYKTREKI